MIIKGQQDKRTRGTKHKSKMYNSKKVKEKLKIILYTKVETFKS